MLMTCKIKVHVFEKKHSQGITTGTSANKKLHTFYRSIYRLSTKFNMRFHIPYFEQFAKLD